jgi:hypothetical protein
MKIRMVAVELDEPDYNAVQDALAQRQALGQTTPGREGGSLPGGGSDRAGALLAEICRDWMRLTEREKRGL